MLENYELVQKGFRILHPLMASYIGRELSRVYKDNWWREVLEALSDQYDLPELGNYGELIDSLDVMNCLRLIDRRWNEVFRTKLSLDYRTWAKELVSRKERGNRGNTVAVVRLERGKNHRSRSVPRHIHLIAKIPPKMSMLHFMGELKRKSSTMKV